MKLRNIRGPNWVDASVRATMVMEKTTPVTVMTAAAIAVRIWRAASALPELTHDGIVMAPLYAARSSAYVHQNRTTAATTSNVGTTHKVVRNASRRQLARSRYRLTTTRPSIPSRQHPDRSPRLLANTPNVPTRLPGDPAAIVGQTSRERE